ncbi:MAG: 2-oxo acid dehydrogenase subunit E2 [Nitriliruptoraceae bacterium]|nr:2-oxo acid dehydrogenase subunit E2 [Nitriliruptoraceae bacterium]
MAALVRMPGISADSEEATLLEWQVEQGASVGADDPIATVETDKAEVDITPDSGGTVWRLLVEPGEDVLVGAPIAILLGVDEGADAGEALLASIGGAGSEPAEPRTPAAGAELAADTPVEAPAAVGDGAEGGGDPAIRRRTFVSPLARRTARERGVDLGELQGSGPGGRILRVDVERAEPARERTPSDALGADGRPPAPSAGSPSRPAPPASTDGAYEDVPHTSLRRAIASRLVQSKQHAPHFYLEASCRVDALVELREQINATSSVRVSINDLVLRAVATALRDVPDMNVNWTEDAVRRFERVDVAVAVASDRGLMTPVVRDAANATVTSIATTVRDLADRASRGALKQHELEGGSFTVTNLGMFGTERFAAVINPPQAGILAVGSIVRRAVVADDGSIEAAQLMDVTLSADHRPVDGVVAARWLRRFQELIEAPITLLA